MNGKRNDTISFLIAPGLTTSLWIVESINKAIVNTRGHKNERKN